MKRLYIACISDIHNHLISSEVMPEADMLIIAGDATSRGSYADFMLFKQNLEDWSPLYKYIVYVPGKHDAGMEEHYQMLYELLTEVPNVVILVNTDVELLGLTIWGSPNSKADSNWAFTQKAPALERTYDAIPSTTDILVTYAPAFGVLDIVHNYRSYNQNTGCRFVRKTVERIKPLLHVFGSAHDSYGYEVVNGTQCVNASYVNEEFLPRNEVQVIELEIPQ